MRALWEEQVVVMMELPEPADVVLVDAVGGFLAGLA